VSAEAVAVAAAASHREITVALAGLQAPAPSTTAQNDKAASMGGSVAGWRSLLVRAVLVSLAGLGLGIWLGQAPAVVFPWSPTGPGELRLRLDDTLADPASRGARVVPRDRTQRATP
jgi:hypothetical protein